MEMLISHCFSSLNGHGFVRFVSLIRLKFVSFVRELPGSKHSMPLCINLDNNNHSRRV